VQVYQSAYAPEKEREEEAATDLVHNFVARRVAAQPTRIPFAARPPVRQSPTGRTLVPTAFESAGRPDGRLLLYGLPAAILVLAFGGARAQRRFDDPREPRIAKVDAGASE
jgi:hypothetical protein